MKRFRLVLTSLLILIVGLASCVQMNTSNQQGMANLKGIQGIVGQDQSSSTNTVTIQEYSFQPSTLTVPKGTTVTWRNQGRVDHTVTSDTNGLFDSRVSPGKDFSFTFSNPGTYNYHCSIHTSMHGTIMVTGSAVSTISTVASTAVSKAITGMPGTTQAGGKSSASWSEMPLSGEKLTQGPAIQGLTSHLNLSQNFSQNEVLQFSQYYKVTPQAPSKPLTSPTQFELKGQEPAMLYFGTSQKAVPYSQYQSYALYTGLNSFWVQGSSSWTQYAQVPQGSSLSLLAMTNSAGNGYLYEVYPGGTRIENNGYYFYPYTQIGFYADEVGEHLLFFVIGGQPSNIVVIDVVPYQPPPPPVYNYASITVSSNWLRGYDVYVDGSYEATEGTTGEPAGVVTITVPGDQYHTVAVNGDGFSFSDSKFFNAGWSYTLNV